MANISFECSYCRDTLTATSDMKGQTIPCPSCGKDVQVPSGEMSSDNKRAIIMLIILVLGLGYYGFSMYSKSRTKKAKQLEEQAQQEQAEAQKVEEEIATAKAAEEEAAAKAKVAAEARKEIAPGILRPKFKVGDPKQAVLSELGKPKASWPRGNTETLIYKHFEIQITNGKVSLIQLLKSK